MEMQRNAKDFKIAPNNFAVSWSLDRFTSWLNLQPDPTPSVTCISLEGSAPKADTDALNAFSAMLGNHQIASVPTEKAVVLARNSRASSKEVEALKETTSVLGKENRALKSKLSLSNVKLRATAEAARAEITSLKRDLKALTGVCFIFNARALGKL